MKRKFASLLAALALTAGGLAVTSQPASAATPPGCLTPYTCLYVNSEYGGFSTFYSVTASANQGCTTFSGTLNNNIESIYGNYVGSGKWVGYFNSHNCTGTTVFASLGGAYPTLPASARNVISSMKILSFP